MIIAPYRRYSCISCVFHISHGLSILTQSCASLQQDGFSPCLDPVHRFSRSFFRQSRQLPLFSSLFTTIFLASCQSHLQYQELLIPEPHICFVETSISLHEHSNRRLVVQHLILLRCERVQPPPSLEQSYPHRNLALSNKFGALL